MRRGFTLIETLIYLAIFSIVISGLVAAAYLLLESSGKAQVNAMMLQEEQFLMMTIERYIGNATAITVPVAGASGSTLTFSNGNSFTLSGTNFRLNGANLNNTNVRVTSLSFKRTSATPDGITAEMTVETNAPNGAVLTYSASTTKYLRK